MNKELQRIEKQFGDFMDGYRFIMLTHRKKDDDSKDRTYRTTRRKKIISTNKKEFLESVDLLLESKEPIERICSSVNQRDMKKAIRLFKQRQLDANYFDEDSRNSFYLDIKNRWISAIMSPSSRAETKFLIDVDNIIGDKSDISFVDKHLKEINVKVLLKYPTKNGWHIITEPFNPTLWNSDFGDIKKDGLLLLNY